MAVKYFKYFLTQTEFSLSKHWFSLDFPYSYFTEAKIKVTKAFNKKGLLPKYNIKVNT